MLLLSATAIHPQTAVNINAVNSNNCHASATWPPHTLSSSCRASLNTSASNATSSSSSLSSSSSSTTWLRHVSSTWSESDENAKRVEGGGERKTDEEEKEEVEDDDVTVSSAAALAAAIGKASKSPVEFVQRIDKAAFAAGGSGGDAPKSKGLVLPSPDFQTLCVEQLRLFRRIVDPQALLSVYVRPAGSYVMDQLELRRVTFYPGDNAADLVILVGNFSVPAGLRAAEAAISSQQVEFFPEHRAVVFPMVKHPFVVGFLVAELPKMGTEEENGQHDGKRWPVLEGTYALPPSSDLKLMETRGIEGKTVQTSWLTSEQRLNAINISCSLAMAYVLDQKAMLLQQSSWQNNIRMSNLVEQIRGSLLSIRTLSKMLSVHMRRNEISYDIVEDIIVQGDQIRDTLQQLQDAAYLTKANIMRYNEETLKKITQQSRAHSELGSSQLSENFRLRESSEPSSLNSTSKDLEMPMPPLALAPLRYQEVRRPCNVSNILEDLVGAVKPLAHKQQQVVEMCEFSKSLHVAVEEPALRQALSNLIEGALLRSHVGGRVEIVSTSAPAGGALVIIDDNGPDMHYMTQLHSLTPFGADLLYDGMIEDNMTWNFVASLTVAQEILESYGCVVRVISPRITDAAIGAGGTRVELWLPSFTPPSDFSGHTRES